MARRRVNTRFLIILTAVVGVLAVAGVVVQRVLVEEDPRVYLQSAQQFAGEKRIPEAVAAYYRAVSLDSRNPDMWVSYGDFCYGLAWYERELLARANDAYGKALEIDPGYLPALRRLLNSLTEESRVFAPDPTRFSRMRELADKIRNLDPSDTGAEASYHLATIRAWMAGIETPRSDIDASIEGLKKLMERDPANAELPLHVAMANLHRGQEASRLNDQRTAAMHFAEAEKVMFGAATAQEQSAAMQFQAYRIAMALAIAQRDEKERAKYRQVIRGYIEKAQALTKPEDADYSEIMVHAAEFAVRDGRRDEADKIFEDLLAKFPNDQALRLTYARHLAMSPARRAEAIRLLDQPPVGIEGLSGPRAFKAKDLEGNTRAALADIRMDVYPTVRDEAERKEMLAKIEEGVDSIIREFGETPPSLKLRGKLQLIKGQNVEAVQTLEKIGNRSTDLELQFLLARAYVATQQSGAAKGLLSDILAKQENHALSRLLLIELLLRENNLADARPHIEFLQKQLPDEPQVIRLQIAALDPVKDKEKIRQSYRKLPEDDRAAMLVKAQTALAIRDLDEATRLLNEVRKQDPGDEDAAEALVAIYLSRNQNDQALATVDDALEADPENLQLQMLRRRIQGASPEELLEIQRKYVELQSDPLTKELQLAELARREGKAEQVVEHLRKAESIKPDNARVLELLFQHHLQAREWDQASAYAEKLGKLDADKAGGTEYQFRINLAKGDYSAALAQAREYVSKLPEFAQSWVALGQALQATGQHQEALQKYVEAVRRQSVNADAIKGIIACYYELRQPEEAAKYIAQARRSLPNDASFQELEINHNLNHGDPLKAIPPLEQALKNNPDRAGNYATLGLAYVRAAQKTQSTDKASAQAYVQKARDMFSQGLQKWPDEKVFYGYMADLAFATNAPQDAEKWLKDLAQREAWKDKPDPLLMLAEYHGRVGNVAEAEKQLRAAIGLAENAVPVQQRLAGLLAAQRRFDDALAVLNERNAEDPRVQKQRVEILIADNRFDEAEKALLADLQKAPDSPDLLTMLGVVLTGQRKFDEAEATLNKVLAGDAKHPVALHQRALVRLQKPIRDLDGAISDLQQVRELSPADPDVRIALSDAYRMKNQLPQAIAEMEAALKAVPMNRAARLQLVNMYSQVAPPRPAEVDRVLSEAQTNPQLGNDPIWWQQHAMILASRGDTQGAMAKIRRALELAPQDINLYKSYIDVLAQTGQYELLVSETDKAIAANGNKTDWWVYNARAVAKSRLGDKDAALAEFGSALNVAKDQGNDAAGELIVRTMARDIGVDQAIRKVQERAETGEPRWRIILAMLHNAKRDDQAAIKILESLRQDMAKLAPEQQLTVLRLMGNLYLTTDPPQPAKAQEAYLQLLDKVPNDWTALNNLACLLAESVNPPEPARAKIYSQRAYDLMRNQNDFQPLIADTHGWVLTLCNEVDAGIDVLQRVVERAPFLEAHYHLAEAYLKKSYHEQALRQLELAQAIVKDADQKQQPISPEVRRRIGEAEARAREGLREKSAQVQ